MKDASMKSHEREGARDMSLHGLQYAGVRLEEIDIEDISLQPGPYCMSFGYDERRLIRSIEKIGLLNPPCLVAKSAGGFDVVSGYRRILAARSLDWEKIFCRDLTGLKMTTFDLLLLNLCENLPTRSFNEVEKAMALTRLSLHVSHEELIRDYMPLLGLSPHEPILQTYLLFEELKEPMKGGLAQGIISIEAALLLPGLDAPSGLAVYECILNLKLNYNYQKQLIEFLIEISEIENVNISEIFSREPLSQILRKESANSPQKAKTLLGALRAMRNPRVADAEHRFQHQLSSIHFPPGVRVIHSPFFEQPSFTLEVSFKNGSVLKEKILRIATADGVEKIQAPWLIQDDD
jgi:ParB family transcriptional regulator, chromosome partitioning protein